MRYTRIQTNHGPRYAAVEKRNGKPWVTHLLPDFPETPARHVALTDDFDAIALDQASLLAPVQPSKIVCVGRNYRDHATELGNDVPKEPLIFLKPPSSLLGPGGTIVYPALSSRVDFEGELAIVIGRQARNITAQEDTASYIRGYTLVNDVTARDLQKSDGQWTRGKGFDTFCPVGPTVTDELDPIAGGLELTTTLNGEQKQHGNTRDFLFGIPELLRYISAFLTLEPGDLIPTGTPAGVGPMRHGDTVEVTIEGIGTLRNTVSSQNN